MPVREVAHYFTTTPPRGLLYIRSWDSTVKTIRIQVETYDGLSTIWYEKSRLKNPTDAICKRVNEQLCGLNIKRIEVSLSPATVWQSPKWHKGVAMPPTPW